MAEKIDQLGNELVKEIEGLVKVSEGAFLSLGELYPRIVKELDASLAQSRGRLDRRGSAAARADVFGAMAAELAASGNSVIADSREWFASMNEEDGVLIKELQSSIDSLAGLDAHIDGIREDSVEMELVSLNALTVALKSGAAGKGFSVITEELKRLSARTIAMTERLTETGKLLFGQFTAFRAQLELLELTREELSRRMEESLGASFKSVESAIVGTSGAVRALIERSATVRAPILAVMEGIQFGDILRQSADHVILSLRELRREGHAEGAAYLDELRFLSTLAELASTLLTEIGGRLAASAGEFERRNDEVARLIEEGERERKRLLGDRGGEAAAMERAIEAIREAAREIKRYASMKGDLLAQGEGLITAVGQLEDKFKSFTLIVNRFRTIDIASRIEVAKQIILRTMNDTVQAMSELTVRIEADVGGAVERTKGLIEATRDIIGATRLSYGDAEIRIGATVDSLGANLAGVEELKDAMEGCLRGFTLYTDDFLSLIASSSGEIGKLRDVCEGIERALGALAGIRAGVEREYRAASGGGDLREAELGNGRLKAIIERFTIFTHKKAAGELGGFDVEGGADDGEVTLF